MLHAQDDKHNALEHGAPCSDSVVGEHPQVIAVPCMHIERCHTRGSMQ